MGADQLGIGGAFQTTGAVHFYAGASIGRSDDRAGQQDPQQPAQRRPIRQEIAVPLSAVAQETIGSLQQRFPGLLQCSVMLHQAELRRIIHANKFVFLRVLKGNVWHSKSGQ